MGKLLLAVPDLCTGCSRCALICSAIKEGEFRPSKSRIHINDFSLNGYSVPSICFQCPKPDCLEACPEKAIYKNEDEVVIIEIEKCNGCGDCVQACPYGMIEMGDNNTAQKCDYCEGQPACVDECPTGALIFNEIDSELRKNRGLQMKQRSKTGSPDKKRHHLGVNILASARM